MNAVALPPPLQAIAHLAPQVAAEADHIEQQRSLPGPLVDQLKSLGAFRALLPSAVGGLQSPFEDYIQLIQQLAQVDASTAWCINQGAVVALTTLWLQPAMLEEMWQPDTVIANGPPFAGEIRPKGEDFHVQGHWGFSSGCQHATWMMGAARYSEGGWRVVFCRPDEVTFVDNWQVPGLRGTGSFEFSIHSLVVPSRQVADVGQPPTISLDMTWIPTGLLFACSFASLALGVAAGALADVLDIAAGKKPRYASVHLRDDPDAQRLLGKAQAHWQSARVYLHTTVQEVLKQVRKNECITDDERAKLRLAGTHVIRQSAQVMDFVYQVAGSTAIYQDQILQRRFQDMRVITQHVQAREAFYSMLGRYAISGKYEYGPLT